MAPDPNFWLGGIQGFGSACWRDASVCKTWIWSPSPHRSSSTWPRDPSTGPDPALEGGQSWGDPHQLSHQPPTQALHPAGPGTALPLSCRRKGPPNTPSLSFPTPSTHPVPCPSCWEPGPAGGLRGLGAAPPSPSGTSLGTQEGDLGTKLSTISPRLGGGHHGFVTLFTKSGMAGAGPGALARWGNNTQGSPKVGSHQQLPTSVLPPPPQPKGAPPGSDVPRSL